MGSRGRANINIDCRLLWWKKMKIERNIHCTVNSLIAGFLLADWLYNTLLLVCEVKPCFILEVITEKALDSLNYDHNSLVMTGLQPWWLIKSFGQYFYYSCVSLGICIWKHPTYIFALLDFRLSFSCYWPNKQKALSKHFEVVNITVQLYILSCKARDSFVLSNGQIVWPWIFTILCTFPHSRPQSLRFFCSRGRRNGGLW